MADLTTLLSQFLEDLYAGSITLTGLVRVGDGTAAAPSYSFASDPNSGVYSGGGDQVRLGLGGTDAFIFTTSGAQTVSANGTLFFGTLADVALSRGAANNLALASGDSLSVGGAVGAATTSTRFVKKVTGIADAAATDVLTVTVPNASHAATIQLTLLSSNGSTDAFESSRTAVGSVVVARTTGVATVAVVSTLVSAQIATVAAGATHTLAYGVSAMTGAVGAQQTFTITVTIDDSGNLGSNQVVVVVEVVNAEATGITVA